jgi:cyclophilin family peptidyl-prolyl cis-trans isomerase
MGFIIMMVLAILGIFFFAFQASRQYQKPEFVSQPGEAEPAEEDPSPTQPPAQKEPTEKPKPPKMQIAKSKKYTAVLTTSKGVLEIELFADKTPITVNNFVALARRDFYNQTIFHRVIEGFMIQGGDPKGDGTGGPGYEFDDEPFTGEYDRGIVAMANSGPNTNGSQFFILHQKYPLPKNYVIFGRVSEGLETVDAIATAPVKPSSFGEESVPVEPTVVESIEIIEK